MKKEVIKVKKLSPKQMAVKKHGRKEEYWGMNKEAEKHLGKPVKKIKLKEDEIAINKKPSPKLQKETARHEVIERDAELKRGIKHSSAHREANKGEKKSLKGVKFKVIKK
jgi:predicted SPOUT superfamily RNA methylase MTH1